MIKLERNDKMSKAIERAKAVRPFVNWLGGRSYSVRSGGGQRVYTLRFEVISGSKLAECDCKAGLKKQRCYHVAASTAVNIAGASIQRQAAQTVAPEVEPSTPPLPIFTMFVMVS